MEEIFIIRDLDTLKALSDARRLEILRRLRTPLTTRQVAERLGENPNSIYYHLSELEKHGLVRVVKTMMKGHLQEKYYQATAQFYTPAIDLFESDFIEVKKASFHLVQSMFNAAVYELKQVLENPAFDRQALEQFFPHQKHLHLSAEKLEEFYNKLTELVGTYEKQEDPHLPPLALLTVVLSPVAVSWEGNLKDAESNAQAGEKR